MQSVRGLLWVMAFATAVMFGVSMAACGGSSGETGTGDAQGGEKDGGVQPAEDAGGTKDTGTPDAGPGDTGPADTGPADTGPADTGPADTGPADTGIPDAGPTPVTEEEPNGFDDQGNLVTQDVTVPSSISGRVDDPVNCDVDAGGTCTDDIDAYAFDAKAGDYIRIELMVADKLTPLINVVDKASVGSAFFRAARLTGDKVAALSVFIPADGTYAVLVGDSTNLGQTPANVGGAGYEYTLTITYSSYSPAAIGALPHSASYTMAVDAPDFYTFSDAQADVLQIETLAQRLATPTDIDTFLTVWDAAEKKVVAANDNFDTGGTIFDSLVRLAAEASKPYTLVVEAVVYEKMNFSNPTVEKNNGYGLSIAPLSKDHETEPNDTWDLANPMEFPGQIEGVIDTPKDAIDPWTGDTIQVEDVDYYSFTAKKGDFVTFTIEAEQRTPASALDSYIQIRGVTNGNEYLLMLNNDSVGMDSRADALIPADGTYYVVVHDFYNTDPYNTPVGGPDYFYTLKGAKGTLSPTAAASLPYTASDAVNPGGTEKFYTFPAKKGQRVTITAKATANANSAFAPFILFYDKDLATVAGTAAATDVGGVQTVEYMRFFDTDATFMAAIIDGSGGGGSDYTFDLSITAVDNPTMTEQENNDDIAHANSISLDSVLVLGTLDGKNNADPADVFKFNGVVGDELTVRTWGGSQPEVFDTVIRILDAAGTELASNQDIDSANSNYYSEIAKWPIPADGVYYISVEPQNDPAYDWYPAGSYILEFKLETCSPGADAPAAGDIVLNEILAGVPAGAAGDANGDGATDAGDQFVEFFNTSNRDLNFATLTLNNAAKAVYKFPCGTVVPAGKALLVFGKPATGTFGGAIVRAAGGTLELTPAGDTVSVKNGATVIVNHTFGAEANDQQSITRNPDITGGFVKHSTATGSGGALFSPGTKVNGLPFGMDGTPVKEVEPNDDSAHATAIPALPAVLIGTLKFWETSNDDLDDYYSFSGTSGQKVTIRTFAGLVSPDITDTIVTLYDSNGNSLASNDDIDVSTGNYYSEIVDFDLPADGTYYIDVQAQQSYGHIPPATDVPGSYLCEVSVQ